MFEQKNVQGVPKVPSLSTSPQREIITMPSEFLVKAVASSRPLLLVIGGMLLLAIVGVSIVVVLNIPSPPAPPAEEPIIPEPQDTPLVLPVVEEPALPAIIPVSPLGAEDADSDGLTNSEEEVFKTDAKNPDTDGDSYHDGDEIINLFDPTKGSGALLKDSGSMTFFTEPALQWSVWVPSVWVITQGDVVGDARIATALPDAFDITHQENPQRLTLDAWVAAAQIGTSLGGETTSSSTSPRSGNNVLWSADRLTAYVTKPGTAIVYRVTYKKGASERTYFPTIFRMMGESMILP